VTQQTQDQGGGNGYDRNDEPGLTADPELTQYFEDLEDALHGALPGRAREPLTWNGAEETTVTFDSIKSTLQKSIPPARPTPPDQYGSAKTGG